MSERSCSPNPSTPPPVDAISITIRTTNPVSGTSLHVDLGDGASDGHPALTAIRAIIVNADRLRIRFEIIRRRPSAIAKLCPALATHAVRASCELPRGRLASILHLAYENASRLV